VTDSRLRRELGTVDAVIVGLSAMIGTGVFVVWQPAVAAAGGLVVMSLLLAAGVAWLNATSTAGLAAIHPRAGGVYHYGRARLGPTWGSLAGFAFVVGKTMSAATAALAVGTYLWPDHSVAVAVVAIIALAAVNVAGVRKTATVSWILVAIVIVALIALVVLMVATADDLSPILSTSDLEPVSGATGVLTGTAVLFYAFAGYARITVLGEEVRDPQRTIPRAVAIAVVITFVLYAVVGSAVLATLGVDRAAETTVPVRAAAAMADVPGLRTAVGVVAALAALGALLSLLAGIGRTAFAMADDGVLPRALAAVHPRTRVPYRAELVAAAVAIIAVITMDLITTLSISAFTVLLYYAVAHLAATKLAPEERRFRRWVPFTGLACCLALAASLPWQSIVIGVAVLIVVTGVSWTSR